MPILLITPLISSGLIASTQYFEKLKTYDWKNRFIHRDVISKTIVAINNSINQALQTFQVR
jgi:hypothetical protein